MLRKRRIFSTFCEEQALIWALFSGNPYKSSFSSDLIFINKYKNRHYFIKNSRTKTDLFFANLLDFFLFGVIMTVVASRKPSLFRQGFRPFLPSFFASLFEEASGRFS